MIWSEAAACSSPKRRETSEVRLFGLQDRYRGGEMKTDGSDASRFCCIFNACWRQPLCCLQTSCLSSLITEAVCVHGWVSIHAFDWNKQMPLTPPPTTTTSCSSDSSHGQIPWYDLHPVPLPLPPAVWRLISSIIFQTEGNRGKRGEGREGYAETDFSLKACVWCKSAALYRWESAAQRRYASIFSCELTFGHPQQLSDDTVQVSSDTWDMVRPWRSFRYRVQTGPGFH